MRESKALLFILLFIVSLFGVMSLLGFGWTSRIIIVVIAIVVAVVLTQNTGKMAR